MPKNIVSGSHTCKATVPCPMCGGSGKNGNLVCNSCGGRGVIGHP